ncbi:PTS system trehalose-specific EIIBC component [Niallia sp. 03133]|uniref:PTS system trehalose-specific EIIBC component n=1 Tax=Niallia sp. 03133 TaxID=3458060 RepID=UPI00404516EB
MSKYTDPAKELLQYIGGKENISTVTHCATRMRFVLNDPSKADVSNIEAIKLVKGTFTQAGQFQVIVGNEVSTFYNEFIKVSGVSEASKDQVKDAAKQNMNWIQRMIAHLAEIFSPLIPAIVVGGLILGFRNIIGDIKLAADGTKTLVEISQFWSGVHSFLWLIGEAIFHFLPVGITWAIAKKMGTTQILGIVLGLTLVSPQLLNAYAVATAKDIPVWDFGFAQVEMIGYQAQVIPAILAGLLLTFLERKLRVITPNSISMIVVPFLSLLPTVIIAHTVLGPIGWKIGAVVSAGIYAGLTSSFGWLFGAVFGFFYAPLVITGLHHMSNAIDLQLMGQFGGTNLWPMIALSNIAQGSAVLAMVYLNRKNEEEKQISIPATISCYLGVTEPAIFGINLKYGFPFIAGMTGSLIAGVVSVGSGVMANSIGVGGIPGILSIQPQHMLMFAVAMLVAIVVPFLLTIILSKKPQFQLKGRSKLSKAKSI